LYGKGTRKSDINLAISHGLHKNVNSKWTGQTKTRSRYSQRKGGKKQMCELCLAVVRQRKYAAVPQIVIIETP
jgi:hypothetical protein